MKEAFNIPSRLVYPFKQSYDEYKHEGLNLFLKGMYEKALHNGKINFRNPLRAFNTAYYIATALNITPDLEVSMMDENISIALNEHLGKENNLFPYPSEGYTSHQRVPLANSMLVRWMVYAILYLQEDKTTEKNSFLTRYFNDLVDMSTEFVEQDVEIEERIRFVYELPKMINECQTRFHTDLYPNLKVSLLTDDDWTYYIKNCDDDTVLTLMTYFRNKNEQHKFHNWLLHMTSLDLNAEIKFRKIVEEYYDELSGRIDKGEFLLYPLCASKVSSIELSQVVPDSHITSNPEKVASYSNDLFDERLKVPEIKVELHRLVEEECAKGEWNIAHWFVVWKVFRHYRFITKERTQARFIRWVKDEFGWDWKTNNFKGTNVHSSMKDIELSDWNIDNICTQIPQAKKFIDWKNKLVDAFLSSENDGRRDCKEQFCSAWFNTKRSR